MTDQEKPAFAAAVNRLCVSLRDKEPDVVQMRVYFETLKDLEIEFVVAAAERLGKQADFFPKTSDWRSMAVLIERERYEQQRTAIAARPKAGLPPLCAACDDTGWCDTGANRVKRCDCRHLRRLEVLGRRPMPELPEAREPVESETTTALMHTVADLAAKKSFM